MNHHPVKFINKKVNGIIISLVSVGVFLIILAIMIIITTFLLRYLVGLMIIVVAFAFFYLAHKIWSIKKDLNYFVNKWK
ncbi:hypothetical protein K8R62_02570 [bacterium]|nr:hypothetical protein [bacterium]